MSKKLTLEEMTGGNEEQKYQNLVLNDQREQNDMISLMAINELLNTKKLKTISRVKFDQVSILTKLYLFADIFGDNFTKKLADLILQIQISTNGSGRKEIVQLVQQRTDIFGMDQPKKSSKDIFR